MALAVDMADPGWDHASVPVEAPFIAALAAVVAAVIAAVLSAVNLAVSGCREQLRWRREALTEVLVTFTDTTFKGTSQDAYQDRQAGRCVDPVRQQRAIDAHAAMIECLTRMRMLAKDNVVTKAEEVHALQDQIYEAIYQADALIESAKFDELNETRRQLRNDFLRAARRNLGLRGAAPISGPTNSRGPMRADASVPDRVLTVRLDPTLRRRLRSPARP